MSATVISMIVAADGTLRCVYDETIDYHALGPPVIRRASHVEPDANGDWHADLSPVGGPKLGPFARRSEALAAERAWLNVHLVPTDTVMAEQD